MQIGSFCFASVQWTFYIFIFLVFHFLQLSVFQLLLGILQQRQILKSLTEQNQQVPKNKVLNTVKRKTITFYFGVKDSLWLTVAECESLDFVTNCRNYHYHCYRLQCRIKRKQRQQCLLDLVFSYVVQVHQKCHRTQYM